VVDLVRVAGFVAVEYSIRRLYGQSVPFIGLAVLCGRRVASRALRMVLGLLLLYRVGWGYYARFWRDKSPVFMGCLAVLGWSGGLTGSCADGEGLHVAGAGGMGCAEDGNLVVSPAAALRPAAEWSPRMPRKAAREWGTMRPSNGSGIRLDVVYLFGECASFSNLTNFYS
jgi:hypothetical protein